MRIDPNKPTQQVFCAASATQDLPFLDSTVSDGLGFSTTGFTTKVTQDGTEIPLAGLIATPLVQRQHIGRRPEVYSVKDPDEIAASLLKKVDYYHYLNPYRSLAVLMKLQGYPITLQEGLPIGLKPDDIVHYVEIKGHPKNSSSFRAIVERYLLPQARELKQEHDAPLELTSAEEVIVDDLHEKYLSDLNLLANVLEQAIEVYVDLLQAKLRLYGINSVRYPHKNVDFDQTDCKDGEIYYDKLIDPNAKAATPLVSISRKDAIPIRILQEQVMPKVLEQVSEVLRKHFFCSNARLKKQEEYNVQRRKHTNYYDDILWDPDFFLPRSRILASLLNIPPSWDLIKIGIQCLELPDLYRDHMITKPHNDIFIDPDSFENLYLRPVYGYLNRLWLRIQMGKEGEIQLVPKEQNPRFKEHYVRIPLATG